MSQGDTEKYNLGAPKRDFEKEITLEVEKEFSYLTPEERASIVKAKLKLLNQHRPALIQVDLGENASKKAKDNLFE